MSAFSFTSSRSKPIAIADIQSGSVSIAIALSHRDKPLEIVASERLDLSFEDRAADATIAALADQIDQVGKKVLQAYTELQKTHGPVKQTYAIINAPWARSQTIRTTATFDKEILITDKIVGDLAKQALQENSEINTENLLEASTVRIEFNGYVTSSPSGKSAHKVAVYALVSDCDPRVRIIVQEGLQKIFSVPISFRSQLRTILSVTDALPQIAKDYCLVDISRETSTIANIHTGLSMAYTAIEEGTISILKRIGGNGLPEETLAQLRMLADENCNSPACETLRASIAHAEPEIVRIFAEKMVGLIATRYLPTPLVLLVEDALAPWLTQLFSRIDFTQFTTTTQPFEVTVLDASHLKDLITTTSEITNIRLSLAAALVYIEERDA